MNAIQIANFEIRQINGFYSLNDLHRASGGENRHKPSLWSSNQQTIDFIAEIEKAGNPAIFKKQGLGTFVCKELVIHYAMWISPQFSLQVIQTFLNTVENSGSLKPIPQTQTALPDCLTLEQQDQIKKLHRQLVQAAPKEQQAKLAITLWSSIKSKFGVSYKKVPSEHYPEVLSLMARVAVERMETLHGEVLDKTQATPFNQTEFACHFVKLLNYARCYLRFQKLICNDPNSPKVQELLNYFQYSVNVN